MCKFPCPCSILPPSFTQMLGLSPPTGFLSMCYRVPLHTYTYAKLCTHITSSFSHSTPTHPLLPSLMCQCVYKAVFLSASSSVCSALSVSISIHLSLSFFSSLRPCGLSRGRAPNVRLAASSLQSRHLSSELY